MSRGHARRSARGSRRPPGTRHWRLPRWPSRARRTRRPACRALRASGAKSRAGAGRSRRLRSAVSRSDRTGPAPASPRVAPPPWTCRRDRRCRSGETPSPHWSAHSFPPTDARTRRRAGSRHDRGPPCGTSPNCGSTARRRSRLSRRARPTRLSRRGKARCSRRRCRRR